jgi:hypothetical protein
MAVIAFRSDRVFGLSANRNMFAPAGMSSKLFTHRILKFEISARQYFGFRAAAHLLYKCVSKLKSCHDIFPNSVFCCNAILSLAK